MSEIEKIFKKPHIKFSASQAEDWVPYIYELALRSLPLRDIAAKIGVHPSTVRDTPCMNASVLNGHADHRLFVENALYNDAGADPDLGADAAERESIRRSRSAALKILKTSIEKKESFIPPQETERLKRLSDAELHDELKKALKATTAAEASHAVRTGF